MHKIHLIIIIACCLLIAIPEARAQCWKGTVIEVADGKTLIVNRSKSQVRVWLYGIAAPAKRHPCAGRAKDFLQELVLDKEVTVCPNKTKGAMGAEVHVLKGFMLNVNQDMLRKGFARSTVDEYKSLEKKAEKKALGIWSKGSCIASTCSTKDTAVKPRAAQQRVITPESKSHNTSVGFSVYKTQPAPQTVQTSDNAMQAADPAVLEQRQQELEAIREKEHERVSDTTLSLTDIDEFKLSAKFSNDWYEEFTGLEISFYYWSRSLDSPVDWSDGDVNCECRVTGHFSEGTNTRIARTNVLLSSFRDRVYIDIPSRYLDDTFVELLSCTVECRLSAGIFDLKTSDKVYLQFIGRPWFYQRPHHY